MPADKQLIALNNGKVAVLVGHRQAVIPDIDPDKPTDIYYYEYPCPICAHPNRATSFNGQTFSTTQTSCDNCGVFHRPIVKQPGRA